MTRSAWARTVRRISRSNISRPCAPFPIVYVFDPPTRSRQRRLGIARCERTIDPRSCVCRAKALPALPREANDANSANKTALGAYVVIEPMGPRDVTLIATGSEVSHRSRGRRRAGAQRNPRRRRFRPLF